jgi:flavin-dependent dehydrogenase
MEEKTYDAAVVGASIAGCTAAILLAREGASVALIERHNDPDAYKGALHPLHPTERRADHGEAWPASPDPGSRGGA